ncbi:hypothetical protein HYR99_31965 [Candidatus Poribacteria bacterium]|nr:hypothetical protein [Candidatus Poribacteria bacterium]
MEKIIVDFEEDGLVMTAYECPDCQTITEIAYQAFEALEAEGLPILREVEEVVENDAGILSIPMSRKIVQWLKLHKGQKVETIATNDKHLLIRVSV